LLLKKEKVLKDVNKKYKIKIYYLPLMEVVDQVCMPIYFPTMIPLRNIFVREQIDIGLKKKKKAKLRLEFLVLLALVSCEFRV